MSGAHLTAPRESRLEAPRIRSNSVGESRAWTRLANTYTRLIAAPVQFPLPPGNVSAAGTGVIVEIASAKIGRDARQRGEAREFPPDEAISISRG